MDPCVPQNSYKTAIIRCPLFSSEASFCQSPGFHSSAMVVFCWEHCRSELRYGEHTDQHFYLWNWWSRHYFKFNASPTFCCHPISESHPVLLLGQNAGWFVLPFSEKLYSYLSQVLASDPWRLLIYLCSHQIPHGRSRTAEFPDAQNVTPWSRWCDDHQGA